MRLTTVILIASLLQVSAATFGQRITISQRNVPLESVLKEIRKQSGYDFFYNGKNISKKQEVSINVTNAELEDALNIAFTGLQLEYTIKGKIITIKTKEEPTFMDNIIARFQAINVRGKVVDEKGQPLVGASVSIKGGKGTTTDKDGGFVLTKVDEKAILVISFIGYLTKEVNANADLSGIPLEVSNSKLDEVQVIAYGTTSKRLSTGNTTTIKAEDIEKQPVGNPLLALQGRVSGLFITQATGYAGSGVTVRIQGQNSIGNGNDPLYVIDGVPFSSQLLTTMNNVVGNSGQGNDQNFRPLNGNPMNYINPNDIESIDVLKDADATAIYGSRAANGAILITTKKGKAGKLSLNFSLESGLGEVARKNTLLNTQQYTEMRREALKNDGLEPDTTRDYDLFDKYGWSTSRNTDWQEELIGNTAKYNNFQTTISGGSSTVQYLFGGTYRRETSVLPVEFANQTGAVHFNVTANSLNNKFKMSMTGNYVAGKNQLPSIDLSQYTLMSPNAPALRNPDGSLNWALDAGGGTTWGYLGNPLRNLENRYTNTTSNLITNMVLSYNLLEGLDVKASLGYNKLQSDEVQLYPISGLLYSEQQDGRGGNTLGTNKSDYLIIEPQLTYRRNFGPLKVDLLLGSTVQEQNTSSLSIGGSGYTSDSNLDDLSSAATINFFFSDKAEYRYNAIFSRLNLNYNDELILNLNARRDGSSRFGPSNLYHTFGSIAGAWLFSSRDFIKESLPFLSFGKLSMSYGTTGSDQIPGYLYLDLFSPTYRNPYNGIAGVHSTRLYNPALQWEETKKLRFGMDLGFLADRVLLALNYSINKSSNQLLNYNLPVITGFGSVSSNFPATVRNRNIELSLTSTNFKNNSFTWTTNLNLTVPKNRLVKFPDIETSSYAQFLVIGEPLNVFKAYKYEGVDPATGAYQFRGADGQLTSSPNERTDRTELIRSDPKIYGGFGNTFSYKSWSLDIFFQFVKQTSRNFNFGSYPGAFPPGSGNQPLAVLNRWKQAGDVADIQRYNADFSYATGNFLAPNSDKGFSDGSYARLKNASLTWTAPQTWLNTLRLANLKIFVQGQNLLTITGYSGLDPETANQLSLPPLRMLTAGINAAF